MISLNLVPPHLRKRKKGRFFIGKFNLPLEVIVGAGGGLLVLLAVIHVFLLLVNMGKLAQHSGLQKKWEAMKPDKENVDAVVNEMRRFQGRYGTIKDVTGKAGLSLAQTLNVLSDNLPRGVWLTKVAMEDGMFFIEGSAVSKETTEIISIHRFTANLKTDSHFGTYFTDVELGSIQRRKVNNAEMADFIITMKQK